MKERPILFSSEMIRAILEGRKTQTRRVIIPKHECPAHGLINYFTWHFTYNIFKRKGKDYTNVKCPYGQPGNRLWVRETFANNIPGCINGISYKADHIDPKGDGPLHPIKWKPSIHMPRWASRINLEITNIRVERVQDITNEDAKSEGAPLCIGLSLCGGGCESCSSHRKIIWFQNLWDSINAKRGYSWELNPWVWVIEFKRCV